MAWYLGIDLGTTFTAAAIASDDGRVRMAALGDHGTSVPSVLFLRDDSTLLVGDAALRRAAEYPDRLARESKRRVGDPVPIMLGGTPYSAELLQARLLRWAIDRVAAEQGQPPAAIAVTHPASWGEYRLDLLRSAIRQVGVDVTAFVPEPVAAATAYATERPLAIGAMLAVYDLGGGTFDCCVVRRDETGFSIVGTPEGIDRLGGVDFDEAVFSHVKLALGGAVQALDADDPTARAALVHLRRECVAAKEALSADTDASMSVLLPNVRTAVRITRPEFEAMIRPVLGETVDALKRTIRGAGLTPEHLSAVLLVGGSSRIPLVAQLVASDLGRPVVVDHHPKDAIALGAARIVGERAAPAAVAAPEAVAAPTPPTPTPPTPTPPEPQPQAEPAPPAAPSPAATTPPRKRWRVPAVLGALLLVAAGGVYALTRGGGGASDEGELVADVVRNDGELATLGVSLPAESALVVRATSDEDLDAVVAVLGDEDAAEAVVEFQTAASQVDQAIVDALVERYGDCTGCGDGPFAVGELVDNDQIDETNTDDLPAHVLSKIDDTGSDSTELLVFPVLEATDVVVGLFGCCGTEGEVTAEIHVVDLDSADDDVAGMLEAMLQSDEFASLLEGFTPDAP